MTVSLTDQVACIDRELRMRRRVYPRLIEGGRMTAQKAYAEIAAMTAVLDTVQALEAKERLI